ncbi:FG-GAP-like repeat-containing protein [Streptomyces sp. Mg1]|uniref:FG-GAP-like repeat-containing protein n=1 Tax=Streptomyces sp. Mg1 TaxID=465541 RepID=UPI0011E06A08|nr:FG-GAP-like repeat-containing protein [Streptomyces sp. Mg1]
MNRSFRRAASIATATAAVAAGLAAVATPALAVDSNPVFATPREEVLAPGQGWNTGAALISGIARGKMIYAFSTKPLTGPVAAADGLPASLRRKSDTCEEVEGAVSVYVCDVRDGYPPSFAVAQDAADMTTAYEGYAYVPRDGDLKAAVAMAQSAGTRPGDATSGSSKVTVKTLERAARNTVSFELPDVAAGASVRQRVRLHATDAGEQHFVFLQGQGAPYWSYGPMARVSEVTTSAGMSCKIEDPKVTLYTGNMSCKNTVPGEHWMEYTFTVPAGTGVSNLSLHSTSTIYTGTPNEGWQRAKATFSTGSGAPRRLYDLLARDASGQLFQYWGDGEGSLAGDRVLVGGGWNTYDQLTKLTSVSQSLNYGVGTPASAMTGLGELVGRDSAGVLWHYQRQFSNVSGYADRTRVGGGWNVYDQLIGAGDIYRDGKPDLLARDKAGVLWLYKGTGNPGSPFQDRVRVAGGWNVYDQLLGSADVTGDGRPDLLARDKAGVLWLYKGNDNPTVPFDDRTRIAGGWNVYNQFSLVGDITGDNRADLVARDAAGVLWLYKGNGNQPVPFDDRTRVGSGWNTYQQLL